jgi:hypothetical protein
MFGAAILLAGLAILGSPSGAQEKSSGQLTLQVIVVDLVISRRAAAALRAGAGRAQAIKPRQI